jgi:hypothetical protein
MSYQSGFQNPKNYSYGSSNEAGVPESMTSSVDQKMISSFTTIKQVSSQNGDQTSGGLLQFQIPSGSGQGYLKSGSAYMKCRITFTQTINAANMIAFQGGLSAVATNPAAVASASLGGGSASAIISRLNISIGGVLVNSIMNYKVLHDVILNHCTSQAYRQNDSGIMEFTGKALSSVIANGFLDVTIPLMAPCINDEQSFPLFLINSPIVIEILLNSVNEAIAYTTTAVTEYKVSNASIIYETINPSADFEMAVKTRLQSGSMWSMSTDDYYNLSLANSDTVNYNIGLNLSSVKGVLWTYSATPVAGEFHPYSSDGQTDAKLYLDGRLINQFTALDTIPQQYMEFQRTIGALYDYVTTSQNYGLLPLISNTNVVTAALYGSYPTSTYCGGIACNRSNDSSFSFTGTPCQTINLTRTCTGTAGTLYIMVLYSQMIMIDSSGSVSIMR